MNQHKYNVDADVTPHIAPVTMTFPFGELTGTEVQHSRKTLTDLRGLFAEPEKADGSLSEEVYSVQWFAGGVAGEGSLLFGCTHLHPGRVGQEFFMTHGHFHAQSTRAEIYFVASGEGVLLRMDRSGHTWAETMCPGSVHYIQGEHAHRTVNTGTEALVFWACWPSDAGHDYASIASGGFGLRALAGEGEVLLVRTARPEGGTVERTR